MSSKKWLFHCRRYLCLPHPNPIGCGKNHKSACISRCSTGKTRGIFRQELYTRIRRAV